MPFLKSTEINFSIVMDSLKITKPVVFGVIGGALIIGVAIFLVSDREEEEEFLVDVTPPIEIPVEEPVETASEVIGSSVLGREIEVYRFQPGEEKHVVFVGGIHGGYEWNTVLLAYEFIDYLDDNPDFIPEGVSVSIIPSANPDGVEMVVGQTGRFSPVDVPPIEETTSGRFNANGVDLNRNFDCNWAPESTWRGEVVSAGEEAFSEPEARVIRDFVENSKPDAVIFWHSAAGAVFGSECNDGILPNTLGIMNAYADASGYPAVPSFDFYEITGDVEGWLASIGIASITVELTTHNDLEWDKNLAGARAVLTYFVGVK